MATAIEVEEATKAARASIRPDDIGFEEGWQVGRYAWASSNFVYNTGATAAVDLGYTIFSWAHVAGIAVIKKVYVTFVRGAQAGTTASGLVENKLVRFFGAGPALVNLNTNFPPPQGGGNLTGRSPTTVGSSGMIGNQPTSQARIQGGLFTAFASGFRDVQTVSQVDATVITAAGLSPIQNFPLYDWLDGHASPLILVPGTGFFLAISCPAVTGGVPSNTVMTHANLQWDEWTKTGDR